MIVTRVKHVLPKLGAVTLVGVFTHTQRRYLGYWMGLRNDRPEAIVPGIMSGWLFFNNRNTVFERGPITIWEKGSLGW